MKTYIIVGMGLSGNATFCQLVNHLISSETIAVSDPIIRVFETNESLFATGAPYQVNCPEIWTLNNPVKDFKFIPEVDDLPTWMNANTDIWKSKFPEINEDYVPRALVGMYLKAQYVIHKKKAKSHGIEVHEHFEEVMDAASIEEGTWQIHGGILINANSQVLNSRGEVQKNLFCIGPVASYGYQYPTPHASFLVFNTVEQAVNSIIL